MEAAKGLIGQQQASKAQANQISAQNAYWQQQEDIRAKQQRDLLQRQLATTRARLAAGGIGTSGSGQALMAAMVRDSEDALSDSQALLDSRISNASDGYSSSGSSGGLLQGLSLAGRAFNMFGSSRERE
jgi:hypothetical protein